jgi:alpha-maltose-1-phosphate synthase
VKILFVNENIGGHATVHRNLAAALTRYRDIEADFYDVPSAGLLRRIVRAPIPGLAARDLDLQPLRAQLALSAEVRAHLGRRLRGVDVMHVDTHNAALLSVDHFRRVPTVVMLDSTNALNAYRLPYRDPTRWTPRTVSATKIFEQRVYDAAQYVVANSEWAAASLRDDYAVPADRLRVFAFGISSPDFGPGPAPGTLATTMPKIVFVGRQLRRKGGDLLREIHRTELADRCELVLVTTDKIPPQRNVTVVNDLVPGDGRLWDILRSSAIFVFPSLIDASPNAVLEAMAAGLPVIATATGAIGEMVVDGRTGTLVTPGSRSELLAALDDLLSDPAKRAAMGSAGRDRVVEEYDSRESTDRLLDLLMSVAGRDPRRVGAR